MLNIVNAKPKSLLTYSLCLRCSSHEPRPHHAFDFSASLCVRASALKRTAFSDTDLSIPACYSLGLVRVSDLLVVNLLALSCFLLLKIRNVAGVPPFQRVSRIARKIGRNIVRGPRHSSIVPQVFMATPTRGRICHFTLSDYYE